MKNRRLRVRSAVFSVISLAFLISVPTHAAQPSANPSGVYARIDLATGDNWDIAINNRRWRLPDQCLPRRLLGDVGMGRTFGDSDAGRNLGNADAGRNLGDANAGRNLGDADAGRNLGDADAGRNLGDADAGRNLGEANAGRNLGNADAGRNLGDADAGRNLGEANAGRDLGDANAGRNLGDAGAGRHLGDSSEMPKCALTKTPEYPNAVYVWPMKVWQFERNKHSDAIRDYVEHREGILLILN